jgi:hypothetical protein
MILDEIRSVWRPTSQPREQYQPRYNKSCALLSAFEFPKCNHQLFYCIVSVSKRLRKRPIEPRSQCLVIKFASQQFSRSLISRNDLAFARWQNISRSKKGVGRTKDLFRIENERLLRRRYSQKSKNQAPNCRVGRRPICRSNRSARLSHTRHHVDQRLP